MSSNYSFQNALGELHDRAVARYNAGQQSPKGFFNQSELDFLKHHGLSIMDVFDFVEDFSRGGEPDRATFLLVSSIRRSYFNIVQGRKFSQRILEEKDLPLRDDELGGIRWLPRIIAKAKAKLRGEMEPSIMYCCGGDRGFLSQHDIHPADFLQLVWHTDGDEQAILDFVKQAW